MVRVISTADIGSRVTQFLDNDVDGLFDSSEPIKRPSKTIEQEEPMPNEVIDCTTFGEEVEEQ